MSDCAANTWPNSETKFWRLGDVVTGDESWFCWRQICRKQANASWVAQGESSRTISRTIQDAIDLNQKIWLASCLEGVSSIKSHIGTEEPQSPPNDLIGFVKRMISLATTKIKNSLKKSCAKTFYSTPDDISETKRHRTES